MKILDKILGYIKSLFGCMPNKSINTENLNSSNVQKPNLPIVIPERIIATSDTFTFKEAVNIYFNTEHSSCPSTYNYQSYFKAAFSKILNDIPKFNITLSDEKVLRNKAMDNPIEDTRNITKRSNKEKLGNFIAIDTETTGLKIPGNDIIEIAAIKFNNYIPVEKFHTYLKPRHPIPIEASRINNITDNMVKDSPTFAQIKNSLQEFIEDLPLVAHNAPFDMKFLHVSGLDLSKHKKKIYDTLQLSRNKIRECDGSKCESYRLQDLCFTQNIANTQFHSAISDALACAILFVDIIRITFDDN